MHTIENDVLKVVVSEHGAELQSIYHKGNEREYLWQGDENFWSRRSPLLFPIVGKVANNTYYVKGKDYHLTQHGFARDMEFQVIEKSQTYVKFMLKANEQTMLFYPFNFKVTVSYRLEENKLTIKFKVYNNSGELMYFSIGGHPAFNTNLSDKGIEDYYLDFEENKTLTTIVVDSEVGLLVKENRVVLDNKDKLELSYDLFKENDTLIFEDVNRVTLKNHLNDQEIKLTCSNFPLLGVWTPKRVNSPFVCLEPWHGAPDFVGMPQEISDKPYIQSVLPDNKFRAMYTIEIK